MLTPYDDEFEIYKQELRKLLSELERDFPDAVGGIGICRPVVDAFCNARRPTNKTEAVKRAQEFVSAKLCLNNILTTLKTRNPR
jgi:hypothetical protein